jgi:hypothetical protein
MKKNCFGSNMRPQTANYGWSLSAVIYMTENMLIFNRNYFNS